MTNQIPNPEDVPSLKPLNNIPYLWVIIGMVSAGLVAFVVIAITRKDIDIVVLGGTVFTFIVTMTTSILALMKSSESNSTSRDTHLMVNSRVSQFIDASKEANIAQGVAEGISQGTDAANARTDVLNPPPK